MPRRGGKVGVMTVRRCDPALMTPEARIAELGGLFARARRRSQQILANPLDAAGGSERACDGAAVDGGENPKE